MNNVKANVPTIGIAKKTVPIVDSGITSTNMYNLYQVGSPLISHDPSKNINALTQIKKNDRYYLNPKAAHDFTDLFETGYLDPIGSLYSRNSWRGITDFVTRGAGAVALIGNALRVSGADATYNAGVDINRVSLLENWNFVIRFKVNAVSGSTAGIGIGIRSVNTFGKPSIGASIMLATGGNFGKLTLAAGEANLTAVSTSSSNVTASVNDTIELILNKTDADLTFSARNISQGGAAVVATYSYQPGTPSSPSPQAPNTGRFTLYTLGGTWDVSQIDLRSAETTRSSLLVIGDSKTQLYYAGSWASRYVSLLKGHVPDAVGVGGGYDRTAEVVARMPEIMDILSPARAVLAIGSNDPRGGIDNATFQANLQSIYDQLVYAGVDTFVCTPFPENAQDLTAQNDFINSAFPSGKVVDLWNTVLRSGAHGLDSLYDSGDGVHPNEAAQEVIADTILNKLGING